MSWARTWIPTEDLSSVDGGRHVCRPYITPPHPVACSQQGLSGRALLERWLWSPPRRLNTPCCVFASTLAQGHAARDCGSDVNHGNDC